MFKFNFDFEDLEDLPTQSGSSANDLPDQGNEDKNISEDEDETSSAGDCKEVSLDELIDYVPPFISYSTLKISKTHSIWKRDLYDAKFQTYMKDDPDDSKPTFDPIQSPSDLIPGVYEGGLKTWECSLDLAQVLINHYFEKIVRHIKSMRGHNQSGLNANCAIKIFKAMEIGCGTGVPSVLLLFHIFYELLFQEGVNKSLSTTDRKSESNPVLELVLQDFNCDVLKLLTFPNILLAFCRAKLLIRQDASISNNDQDDFQTKESMNKRLNLLNPSDDLEITEDLKEEFKNFLRHYKINLRFIYGPWKNFNNYYCQNLITRNDPNLKSQNLNQNQEQNRTGEKDIEKVSLSLFNLLYSSETIYSLNSLDDFTNLLKQVSFPLNENKSKAETSLSSATIILISSKVYYFGVGGGIEAFISKIKENNGSVSIMKKIKNFDSKNTINNDNGDSEPTVDSNDFEGVGRVLMSVEF